MPGLASSSHFCGREPPRPSSLRQSATRSITQLQENALTQAPKCSHPSGYACTWICHMNDGEQQGLNAFTTVNKPKATKRRSPAGGIEEPKSKRHAPRPYEFIPGSFAFIEVIPSDGDDKVLAGLKIKGRGTRDRPFALDIDIAEDTANLDRASSTPFPTCQAQRISRLTDTLHNPVVGGEGGLGNGVIIVRRQGELTSKAIAASTQEREDGDSNMSHPARPNEKHRTSSPNIAEPRLQQDPVSTSDCERTAPAFNNRIKSRGSESDEGRELLNMQVGGDGEVGERECSLSVVKKLADKMTCEERKRMLFQKPSYWVSIQVKRSVYKMQNSLDPSRLPKECWICPDPGKSKGTISRHFNWRDDNGLWHKIGINYGILALIHYEQITDEQKHGFIELGWHLSHLCGNWQCVNPIHHTVEPGPVNIRRNKCFRDRSGPCEHTPRCLKWLKRDLVVGDEGKGEGKGNSVGRGDGVPELPSSSGEICAEKGPPTVLRSMSSIRRTRS
ncbi:hypothetical protein FGG08_002591 [Glutinoglossum americanum]|uniref:Zinc-binding loop region of homing endonuclease domain-containing protein n=1 Tax=Glutinoglossum americanum TaxID=1670608 RepID=A0A9P8I4E8_9PEZI|nr:hypothetical protein FGG08_002591 [Glutinoglossum americanum]